MGCQEIQSWTFSGLVGAFLDLGIAYLLLSASTLAFFASKFLALFGLCLPCPCNGLFGNPNGKTCWQSVLVDCPLENISSVQYSVRSRFPFDSIWDENGSSELDANFVNERNRENGGDELEDEASCSSFQERGEFGVGSSVMDMRDVTRGRCDIKEKEVSDQTAGYGLRCRRKGHPADNVRSSCVSSYDTLQSNVRALSQSPASVSKMTNESNDVIPGPIISSGDPLHCGSNSPLDIDLMGKLLHGFESNELIANYTIVEKDPSHLNDSKFKAPRELCSNGDEKNAVRVLEEALEEEHSARVALYIELEKERSAAGTAADEALAMILRLQEEKASIEMQARQYQRMIEEKSAYDLEEMNILKEILLRREREKHFLEKELEVYRQMVYASEQLDHDEENVGTAKKFSECHGRDIELQNHSLAFEKELPIPELDEVEYLRQECLYTDPSNNKLHKHFCSGKDINEETVEKELVSPVTTPIDRERHVQRIESHSQLNLSTPKRQNLQPQCNNINSSQGLASKITETCGETNDVPYDFYDLEKHKKDSHVSVLEIGPCIHDVHVIEDKYDMNIEISENRDGKQSKDFPLGIPRKCDSPTMSRFATEQDINRRCSDITSGMPPMGCSQTRPLLFDVRRNSMSAVDFERFKLDNEVGWLQERLRIIQEGREKLNTSMGKKEKEKSQLQLLDNIVGQLREIRQSTKSGKVVRQASLPPPSWKVLLKKTSSRSVSLGSIGST